MIIHTLAMSTVAIKVCKLRQELLIGFQLLFRGSSSLEPLDATVTVTAESLTVIGGVEGGGVT